MEANKKIKLVVVDEHTLGYINPGSEYVGVLHASILKGAAFCLWPIPIYIGPYPLDKNPYHKIRFASEKDFDDFRCVFSEHYKMGEHEYQSN